jgi:hypothetical protein
MGLYKLYFSHNGSKAIIFLLSVSVCLGFISCIPFSFQDDTFRFDADIGHGRHVTIELPTSQLLFQPTVSVSKEGEQVKSIAVNFVKKPELENLYHEIGYYNTAEKIVFVYPIFTQAAYGKNGFYYFYNKTCGSQCLTVPIPEKIKASYSSSAKGANVLDLLNYSFITDIDIDQNPDILKNYDRVILLHNEYVTKTEFYAITHHPDVVFLYPNTLYAKVSANYDKNTITLLRGHGYPDPSIRNGFDWKYDNSKYEYDYNCNNWNFYNKGNYTFLNCYPEYKMLSDAELLRDLKSNDPTNLAGDISNWLTYPYQTNSTSGLLDDFGINGMNIPSWVQNPALWTLNGEISRNDFANLITYLSESKIIS